MCAQLLLVLLLNLVAFMAEIPVREFNPQPGPQKLFIDSEADIAIYGGSAGGGKTFGLFLESLRNTNVPNFGAVVFRREYPQIIAEGGLWDTSKEIYPWFRATPREGIPDWRFPSGARIRFSHMQREEDRMAWDGSQIPLICFDQLESFTKRQFFYMLSRNRSACGVKPYIRATCNPVTDHWLKDFVRWWIDDDGWAIPERSGVRRWFIQVKTDMVWGSSPSELRAAYGDDVAPKSVTFIASSILDNQIFLKQNPEYLTTLKSLNYVDRMRLLGEADNIGRGGNWNIKEGAGTFFKRHWFEVVDAAPADMRTVRYWDRAGTDGPDTAEGGKSRTAGIFMGRAANGQYFITDSNVFRGNPLKVEEGIKNTASQDGRATAIVIEQDPGQAGKMEAQYQVRQLAGYKAYVNPVRESKGTRAKPFSAQCEAGNVKLVRGLWIEDFLTELENFDGTTKTMADQVDAASGAFMFLTDRKRTGTWGGSLS